MNIGRKKNGTRKNSRLADELTGEDVPLWRNYLNTYLEKEKQLELDDKFDERVPVVLQQLPNLVSKEELLSPYFCFPSNTFNSDEQTQLSHSFNGSGKIGIWWNMEANPEIDMSSLGQKIVHKVERTHSEKWPRISPCIEHDIAAQIRKLDMMKKRKLRHLLSCQENPVEDNDTDKLHENFAFRKELGHARIPKFCVSLKKLSMVERSCGEHPGLVNGDYITFEFMSENEDDKRVYTEVCLRGMKGMHLIELNSMRVRKRTWKFCFYQALVALLAKTQLRYKYASSINIDYIYDHGWMLFIHMGSININSRHRFDDVVVYNYKYNVELELIQELKDIPRFTAVKWKYQGQKFKTARQLKRPELMRTTEELDWQKIERSDDLPIHEDTAKIEEWFEAMPYSYRDCIFRTCRFSLAFWNDGNFWYLYNPYRCDRYGFWDDNGFACIMKFCTRITLKKHLMILLLNSYAYKPSNPIKNDDLNEKNSKNIDQQDDFTTLQIFRVVHHCVKIHNVEFLQRKSPRQSKNVSEGNYDHLTWGNTSTIGCDDIVQNIAGESTDWHRDFRITWTRTSSTKKQNVRKGAGALGKSRWHKYNVEHDGKLFSLWGGIHPTAEIFERQNRGKQIHACYVICAGMIRIMAPEYWSAEILDAIVMCGDRYYTLSRLQSGGTVTENVIENGSTWNAYLSRYFNIGEILFEVDILAPICGKLYTGVSLWKTLKHMFLINSFAILTCENACLGLFEFCHTYYMLDVNSIGPPIFNMGGGVAYLMRATSFREFMQTLIATIGSIECSSFSLDPINIVNIVEVGSMSSQCTLDCESNHPSHEKDMGRKFQKAFSRNRRTDRTTCKSSSIME